MLNILLHAAVLSLLLQGFLFPLLVLMSLHWLWRAHFEKSKSRERKQAQPGGKEKKGAHVLRPLKCSSCGAGVPLREVELVCPSCGAPVAAPPHYADIGKLRGEALARLRRAVKYLRRATFFSSNFVRWTLFLVALWLFVVPFFLLIAGSEFRFYDELLALLGNWMTFSFVSLILWIIILCYTAGMMTRFRQDLPTIGKDEKTGEAETAVCSMCGGSIAYDTGDLATVCGYCGVETYRVAVAWRARKSAQRTREAATFSLIEAMQASKEKIDDLVSTPAILILIFIICPFFMIIVPYLAYTYITEHLLISVPVVACLIALGYLLRRFYWRKA
jgi:predicted RNA-binding Zn-ribbon protein involved in translation (DUF1610 family)